MDGPWSELLNSDWHDHLGSGMCEDRLCSDEWLRAFLSRWAPDLKNTDLDELRSALRKLRKLMHRMVCAVVAGDEVSSRDWKALNTFLASAPLTRKLVRTEEGYKIDCVPERRDLASLLGEIALSFARVFADGDPTRIRICKNDDCGWVFYDRSRNRSRCWCEGSACGNVMKVRRFRAKRKTESGRTQRKKGTPG